ncbi:MAG TPA: 3-isopropylmalate dehydrogenase [Chthonomonas sp.]|jgi:3-isopropylmalate dehydrogenase|uniref:3-isopropylmalate dehydrogenase n=1 Tax=Chthonomonas sp. TaxID=2282153 RepID=UPI002B4B685F|nr:3-isopropylmalate dehydrogenase [Chthonomonas sp.]HLH79877.1 3-isopropylmalate dehydrogenase [Chthonomonas sp.]
MRSYKVALLPGDGIGPEVVGVAAEILTYLAERFGFTLQMEEALIGGAAYDRCGHPLPEHTLALCKESDAVLLGAVGGPKWDTVQPASLRPEVGALLPLRKELGLYANLRPAKLSSALAAASSLRADLVQDGLDILVVRELTGGIYFGQPKGRDADGLRAVDTCVYTRFEIERILRVGFETARGRKRKLCSVDKANVLETSRLWREVAEQMAAQYPDVELSHMLVDNCAMQLVRDPRQFDVIVTENMFGDILSDEAAMLTGSLGMLPSASLGDRQTQGGTFGLYEPVHGSAPTIAGQNIANPLATLLSAAMLLRHSLGETEAAEALERAVEKTLQDGLRTADIAAPGQPTIGTKEMGQAVRERIEI